MLLITPTETAKQLAISPRTLESWRSRRTNLPFVLIGSKPRYKVSDVEAYLESNLQEVKS